MFLTKIDDLTRIVAGVLTQTLRGIRNPQRAAHRTTNLKHLFEMKKLLLAFLLISNVAFAADDDGFVPLFNGRDLSGWVNANCAPGACAKA